MSADCQDEILADLLARVPAIAGCSQDDQVAFWEQVGGWLWEIRDDDAFDRWATRFVTTLYCEWHIHPEYARTCIQLAVTTAALKGARHASEL